MTNAPPDPACRFDDEAVPPTHPVDAADMVSQRRSPARSDLEQEGEAKAPRADETEPPAA